MALIDEVWGDEPPRSPQNALHTQVSRPRAALPEAARELGPAGYRLVLDDDAIDVTRAGSLERTARRLLDDGDRGASTPPAGCGFVRCCDRTDLSGALQINAALVCLPLSGKGLARSLATAARSWDRLVRVAALMARANLSENFGNIAFSERDALTALALSEESGDVWSVPTGSTPRSPMPTARPAAARRWGARAPALVVEPSSVISSKTCAAFSGSATAELVGS